jgi:hypothetical protein
MSEPSAAGIPPGLLAAIRTILTSASAPVRRRDLLKALEARGHRVSLAGLNRALEHARRAGDVDQDDRGVWWVGKAPAP